VLVVTSVVISCCFCFANSYFSKSRVQTRKATVPSPPPPAMDRGNVIDPPPPYEASIEVQVIGAVQAIVDSDSLRRMERETVGGSPV
jgi:hypothetical protein